MHSGLSHGECVSGRAFRRKRRRALWKRRPTGMSAAGSAVVCAVCYPNPGVGFVLSLQNGPSAFREDSLDPGDGTDGSWQLLRAVIAHLPNSNLKDAPNLKRLEL